MSYECESKYKIKRPQKSKVNELTNQTQNLQEKELEKTKISSEDSFKGKKPKQHTKKRQYGGIFSLLFLILLCLLVDIFISLKHGSVQKSIRSAKK